MREAFPFRPKPYSGLTEGKAPRLCPGAEHKLKFLKLIMRTRRFQWLWTRLLRVALYGLNMGPIDIRTNGEEALIEKLLARLPRNAVLFDVGANRGEYALALLRHAGPDARIFAFEPGARTFELLSAAVPGRPNLRLEQIGFGESAGTLELFAGSQGSALASLYPRRVFDNAAMPAQAAERVEILRIDDYCRAHSIERIHLLKLDVEGHELPVLKGCGELLTQDRIDVIQFEFGGCNIDSRTFLKDFFDLLSPKYSLFRMVADGLVPMGAYRESYEIFDTNNYVASRDVSLLNGMY
jgi:FkbM family methyltransferase